MLSCSRNDQLDYALKKAGKNRTELEKVLKHYETDSLKYKAACFLIENMPFYYSLEGKELDKYYTYFKCFPFTKKTAEKLKDSIVHADGEFNISLLSKRRDIENIDSAYLVRNIDFAFKVWKEQPWGRHVSFSDFCEYILPYRIGDEPLSEWRETLYRRFNPMLDGLRGLYMADDPKNVAQVILDSLNRYPVRFTEIFPSGPHLGPQVIDLRDGTCREFTDIMIYILRSLGVPAGSDMVLLRGDLNAGHSWNFVLDKYRHTYLFSLVHDSRKVEPAFNYMEPKGKVYRRTFSVNFDMLDSFGDKRDEVYPTFQVPMMQDVTNVYAGKRMISPVIPSIHLLEKAKKGDLYYICMANKMSWKPVGWGFYKKEGVEIRNVEGGVVFVLASYKNDELIVKSDPFFVDFKSGDIRYIVPHQECERIILLHKFNLYYERLIKRVLKGVFEGSNTKDFSHPDTLFQIQEKPVRLFTEILLPYNLKRYRYVRYKGARESYCDISEISFFEHWQSKKKLEGLPVGTPGCFQQDGSHEFRNVFDGDPYTSFDYYLPYGGWAGLDLRRHKRIGKIIYTPRSQYNFIRKGDVYELFHFNKGEWVSIGRKTAESDSIVFFAPRGGLLYLKDRTQGQDERIFEYINGKQVFR